MSIDTSRITAGINSAWDAAGAWVILAAAVATVALVLYAAYRAVRSPQRARVVATLTAVIVLAWTSEGLWEVARHTIGLPNAFAAMTFFVFEAMMITAGMQAEEHRRRHGTPGRAGRMVWVLALATATVVGLNSATLVEGVLRFLLPLLAAGLWWVGVTAPRDSDTPEILTRRADEEARREATWAITPRTLLVRIGWMRPRAQTTTEAERTYRLRRMVVAADRLQAAPGSWSGQLAARRLRRLVRHATEQDVATVVDQVARAATVTARIAAIEVDKNRTSVDVLRWTEVDMSGGQNLPPQVDNGVDTHRVNGVDIAGVLSGGHDRSGGVVDSVELSTRQERLMSMLAEVDRDGRARYPTHKDFARKLRVSPRTVARELRDLRQVYGVKSDGQLRDIAGGQSPAPQVDIEVDMSTGHGVDNEVDKRHANGVDNAGGHDRTTEVVMSTGQDRP